jgi:hypothetical protein
MSIDNCYEFIEYLLKGLRLLMGIWGSFVMGVSGTVSAWNLGSGGGSYGGVWDVGGGGLWGIYWRVGFGRVVLL